MIKCVLNETYFWLLFRIVKYSNLISFVRPSLVFQKGHECPLGLPGYPGPWGPPGPIGILNSFYIFFIL